MVDEKATDRDASARPAFASAFATNLAASLVSLIARREFYRGYLAAGLATSDAATIGRARGELRALRVVEWGAS